MTVIMFSPDEAEFDMPNKQLCAHDKCRVGM